MEPDLLRTYFYDLAGHDGTRFVAVTDPGSKLEATAKADGFAHVFAGDPAIGGRYSVLSAFGMVPAAVMGVDVAALYEAAKPMLFSCGADVPPAANPGVYLGIILGEAALAGRDKLTLFASRGLSPMGAWLEQLVAESTGKNGKGIVPVDLEPIGEPQSYGHDRIFVYLHLDGDENHDLDERVAALAAEGHPCVSIRISKPEMIAQEFYRWEVATAIAGAVIGIDPFDQPDVEDAKVATRKLVDAYEVSGRLSDETPIAENVDFSIFAADGASTGQIAPIRILRQHLATLKPGMYFGLLAYIERDVDNAAAVAAIRSGVRDQKNVATVAGFGPRFLHSTGQVYKGGPKTGVFLTITRDPDPDIAIPDRRASFGTIQRAQARGDTQILSQRGQQVLRIHLKHGGGGIHALRTAILEALPN